MVDVEKSNGNTSNDSDMDYNDKYVWFSICLHVNI